MLTLALVLTRHLEAFLFKWRKTWTSLLRFHAARPTWTPKLPKIFSSRLWTPSLAKLRTSWVTLQLQIKQQLSPINNQQLRARARNSHLFKESLPKRRRHPQMEAVEIWGAAQTSLRLELNLSISSNLCECEIFNIYSALHIFITQIDNLWYTRMLFVRFIYCIEAYYYLMINFYSYFILHI